MLAIGGVFADASSVRIECPLNGNTLTCTPKGNIGLTPSLPDGVPPAGVAGALSYERRLTAYGHGVHLRDGAGFVTLFHAGNGSKRYGESYVEWTDASRRHAALFGGHPHQNPGLWEK